MLRSRQKMGEVGISNEHLGREGASSGRYSTRYLAVLIAIAVFLRFGLSLMSYGSDDAELWEQFGRNASNHGMLAVYRQTILLNHPPIPVMYATTVYRLAEATGVRFGVLFRLAPIAGDVLILACLWWLTVRRGVVKAAWVPLVFVIDPISVIVSGFHCNTDSLYVAFVLASGVALYERRDALAGFLFGVALNIKLLPLVLLLPLLLTLPVGRVVRMFRGAAVMTLPFVILGIVDRRALTQNILGYGGTEQTWGIPGVLGLVSKEAAAFYFRDGRWILLGAAYFVGVLWRWRRVNRYLGDAGPLWLMLVCGAMFFVLTPAYAVQYTVLLTPFALMLVPRAGVVWSVVAGAFLACVYGYYLLPGMPLKAKAVGLPYSGMLWGLSLVPWAVAWGVLGATVVELVRQMKRNAVVSEGL